MPLPRSRFDPHEYLNSFLIGESAPMRRLKSIIPRVARSGSSVLIQGESGTGKELIARAIHQLSPRSTAPFVAENCAALPDGVIESELFGHVRGAFTGADRDHTGLIELADGGTFFMDEVGDLPPRIQAKLLRVIQEGEFRPVGSRSVRRSDFRVIAATHRDLPDMVARGLFREDLYYRLNVIHLEAPPLCDRAEDVPLLVEHIIGRLSGIAVTGVPRGKDEPAGPGSGPEPFAGGEHPRISREGAAALPEPGRTGASGVGDPPGPAEGASLPVPSSPAPPANASTHEEAAARGGISREAMEMLRRYHWPGNVRELQNVVEAGLVLASGGVIGVAELPQRIIDHALAEPPESYAGAEKPRELIMLELALARFEGDKAKAARYIGWSRPKLYRVMAKYGIPRHFGRRSH